MSINIKKKSEKEHKIRYKEHLARMAKVTGYVKLAPPIVPMRMLSGFENLRADFLVLLTRNEAKNKFLQVANEIDRTTGRVNTFGFKPPKLNHKNIIVINKEINRIELENKKLIKVLKTTKPRVASFRPVTAQQAQKIKEKQLHFQLPTTILKKYKDNNLKIPTREPDQRKLFRPEVYFDMELEGLRKIGRLVIQLFTEAAPQVVYEIALHCMKERKSAFQVSRLFPNLYLEIDVKLPEKSSLRKQLEYDKRVLRHDNDFGILSFPEQYINGFYYGTLCFDISFRPLEILNQKRVAFGRLIRGKRAFSNICEFGNPKGKLTHKIIIRRCGML